MTDLTISSSRAPSHRLCAAGESLIDSTSPSSDLRWPSQGRDPSNTWPEEQGSWRQMAPPEAQKELSPLYIPCQPGSGRGQTLKGNWILSKRGRGTAAQRSAFLGFGRSVHRQQTHTVRGAALPAPVAQRMATGSRTHTKRAAVTTGPGRAGGCMPSLP